MTVVKSLSSLKILAINWIASGSFGQPIERESFTGEICTEVASPEHGDLLLSYRKLQHVQTMSDIASHFKLTKKSN